MTDSSGLHLQKQGQIWILTQQSENSTVHWQSSSMGYWQQCLDRIESDHEPSCLIIDSSPGSDWCSGIDMQWYLSLEQTEQELFQEQINQLLLRLAALSMPTLACVNGTCKQWGALLALVCDFRLMANQRAILRFTDLKTPIATTPSTASIFAHLPPSQALCQLVLEGRAFGAQEAVQAGLADANWPDDEIFHQSLVFAEKLARKNRNSYTTLKRALRRF